MHASSSLEHPDAPIPRVACVIASAALLALGLVLVRHGEINADEGFYLVASRFVADGLRPFRDFGFTQTPLVPYANVPWLTLFGYDLAGIRLAGLGWTMVAVVTGIVVLQRRHGWIAPTVFVLLLFGSPGWLAWTTKGKTYAFSGFTVLLGAIAVTMPGLHTRRWALFIAAAALGVASRLTTAAFFLPAGLGLLAGTPNRCARLAAVAGTAMVGVIVLQLATAGTWDNFWFWTVQFHAASTIQAPVDHRLLGLLALAPTVWIALAVVAGGRRPASGLALLALLGSMGANVLLPHGYAEYAATFVPALAWILAPALAAGTASWRTSAAMAGAVAVACGTWLTFPSLGAHVPGEARAATEFLAAHTGSDAVVVASMPEIPIAAGRTVPPPLAMGKFALTERLSPAEAEQRLLLTPAVLTALLADRVTQALVLSTAERWSFSWSVPDYHYLTAEAHALLFTTIRRDYELAYANSEYVIYLRKHRNE